MATFEELFPDQQQAPFEPIKVGRSALGDIRRTASSTGANAAGAFGDAFGDLLGQPPAAPAPEGQTEWADYGKQAVSGVGQVGQMLAGAGEYVGGRLAGEGNTPFEQGAADFAGAMRGARQSAQNFSQDWYTSMTPEAQQRAAREVLSLDPTNTIWQGGIGEFLSSVGLKMAGSAPSTVATLLPGALIMRAGMTGGALAYLGASEGGLSMGSIAANIAQEIEQAPEAELMQSQRYAELRNSMDEDQARQALIREAQGYAPVIGGLVVGAISAAAGRYLEPVFTDKAGGAISRFSRGFASEAMQEAGQSGAEQVAQNIAAQVFDQSRGAMQGVGEQMTQGAMIGGMMGGATTAAVGPRHQAIPTGAATVTGSEAQAPAPAAPESFSDVFGDQTAPAGGWRGGDIETGNLPDIDATGQRMMNMGPVDPALQAAMNARKEGLIQDMFEQGGMSPQQEQQSFMQKPWPVTQTGMELPQATRDVVPVQQQGQMPLGLRERVRGEPPRIIEPVSAQPFQEDLNPPEQYAGAPSEPTPRLGRPTRADMLRHRAYLLPKAAPTFRDETQIDLFGDPESQATTQDIMRIRAEIQDAVNETGDQRIAALAQQLRPQMTRGEVASLYEQFKQVAGIGVAPPEFMQQADEPSAEPLGDLRAQLDDLSDPDSPRTGVYLSRANIAQLLRDNTFEDVRGLGVPLANFDGKGGTLIAKNRQTAERLIALRDSGTKNMQEILGEATGAGVGKLVGADIAVQQRDEQGNVVRESLVSTPEEADALAQEFDSPGREGVILSAGMAIKRRAQRIREESRQAGAAKDVKQTRRRSEQIIEQELGDSELGQRAIKKIGKNTLSENEAARRLVEYGSRLRKRELKKRLGDVDVPEVLDFENPKAAEQYGELFGEYRDTEISERMATTAEAKLKAKARREGLRRQIGALRRLNKATTKSEKVVGVARKISAEEVQKIERAARETARRTPESEGDILGGATRTLLERATEDQIKNMSDSEVNLLFAEAADVASGSRVKRGSTTTGTRATADAGATTTFTPHGKTLDEIIAAHPTRSEKVKLIGRVKRMMQAREHGGKSRTQPITGKAGMRKTAGGEKVAVRRGELRPMQAFEMHPPREMSREQQATHDKRVKQSYYELDQSIGKLDTAINKVFKPAFQGLERTREANGNPPQHARDLVYGRVYLRTLYRYGNLLARLRPRSVAGLKEVERFTKTVNELTAAPKDKFISKLATMTEAEIDEQAKAASRVDPTNLRFLSYRNKRRAAALESVANLRERVARAKRLHDVWHKDTKFEEFVAPLMQKLIGYTTRDTSLANLAVERRGLGYVPTFTEMRNLRYALRDFKAANPEELYKPLKRWFTEYGFKFDNAGDLVLAKNAAQYEYVNEADLLRKDRDRSGFRNAPLNYNQKVRAESRRKLNNLLDKERSRRAGLTRAQRAREDRTLAARIEKDRRSGMSIEQRKALDALDRQSPLYLHLTDMGQHLPELRAAGETVAAGLESGKQTFLDKSLKGLATNLPANHPYRALIDRLLGSGIEDAVVQWGDIGDALGKFDEIRNDNGVTRVITLNRQAMEARRALGMDPAPMFVHALLHESVHAATAGAIHNNPRVKAAMWAIMRQARTSATEQNVSLMQGEKEFYGFRDNSVDEFVAEAFTNPAFQNKLREIKIAPGRSVWQSILDLVKRLLGLADTPQAENVLDAVLSTTDKLFTGEIRGSTRGAESTLHMEDTSVRDKVANVVDKVMQSNRVTRDVRQRAKNAIELNKESGTRALLSALTMEQIGDFYRNSFGGGTGPLAKYMKAFFQRNADNSANMEQADKLSRRWTTLVEQHGAEQGVELSRIMTEATLYGMHPDQSVASAGNSHLKSASQKDRHTELARRYRAMNSDWKGLYGDVQKYYDESMRREIALMTLNALRASVGDSGFNYTEDDIERKGFNTIAGLQREFGDRLTDTERKTIYRMASLPQMRVGPYFPLMRFGDYVVTANKVRETKQFTEAKAARTWANEQRENDPTLSVSSPIENDNGFSVTVSEKEVRMAETPSEAEQNRQEMVSSYGSENVSQVQLKAQLYTRGATIDSNSGLKTILGKLDGNPAAQAAIKDFYLRSLADGAFRKREIKRANRRGVDYDTQHRTFANYAKSSAYYTSQLRFGWQMADNLIGMQKFVEDVANHKEQSSMSPVRMGEVVREIDTRDKLTHDHVEVSKLVRGGTALSQFMMLTSPSYWMINSTQPYMVTLPWLAARSSIGDATAALLTAQKMIASPIVNQMGESFGGAKALWSKAGAEKAFTVLEQVEDYIKQRGGARADEYIAMLNKLKRESIIDLSFVAELRDIAEGQSSTITQRVLDASRIMSHLTEVNNRIMTAIAAYDLYRNKGASTVAAEAFAKQAVSLTQFNYSSGNAPRLFQARGPLGQMGPLVFQFMKYPQHMYALLIDNMRRAVASGGIDRQIAMKTLAGLFATHLAAGGLIGMMLQPVKWAIGLAMAAFGDEDEPYTLKNALSGETFDRMIRNATAQMFGTDAGEVLSAGLPRAAGVDLSNRMSLGTLYFIDLKTDTAESTLGSLASSFGGPLVNLGLGFWKGAQYMAEGQVAKGMEAFLPKAAKDISKALRYTNQGLTDATGKEIIGADKMSPWQLFAQSVGFQPSNVSEAYARRAAIKDAQGYDKDRRQNLMRRFQNASQEERADLLAEIARFNKANPAAGISRSQLLKSLQSFKERGERSSSLGLDLRGKDVLYEHEGDIYEHEY